MYILKQNQLIINNYLLLLQPSTPLTEKIMAVKHQFAEKYKLPELTKAKPNITLAIFKQLQLNEPNLLRKLATIATKQDVLKVILQNFGSYPAHTIYINVETKSPIQNLVKAIRSDTQQLLKLDKDTKPYYLLESHITIAKKLLPWQYEQAWLEYSHTTFSGAFIADKMVLLKRSEKDTKWQVLQEFYFTNQHTITTQSKLF